MRKILTLIAMMALAGCGGGGGANTSPNPNPQPPVPTTAPASGYVTPQFTIRIPVRQGTAKGRTPQFISSATASVKITLTADSVGIDPTTISGNPAITNIAAGSCNSGCTVNGPPTPPGTDSFTIITYDANGATGHAINAAQANNVTITAGQNTAVPITLGAIPATLSVSGVPTGAGALTAGTQSQTASISVVAADGHGDTIPTSQTPSVFYVDATGAALNVTVSDPDTNLHGSCVINSGTSTCTSAAATSVTFSGPDVTRLLAYDGLAENPVTLTASASGATNGTASFQPKLNAPAFNSSQATPSGVALTGSAEIDLFATTGVGSTGSESFTESGWTNTPYNHALLVTATPACTPASPALSGIATVVAGSNSTLNGTPFTATVVASPTAGSCPVTVGDGLSSNTTDGSATLTVTYTTSSVNASSKRRQ
jgi:hypothetical protein